MTSRVACKVSVKKVPETQRGARVSVSRMVGALDTGYHLTSTTLKYYFWKEDDTGLVASSSLEASAKRNWSDDQKTSVRTALAEWAKISAFTFAETEDKDEAFVKAVLLDDPSYLYLGEARFPTTLGEGEFYVSYTNASAKEFPVGSYDYITILHEMGHVLGLAHPHDGGGTSSLFPGVDSPWDMGTAAQNQTAYTVMSYNDVGGSITPDKVQDYGFVKGPMAYDIATIQAIYPLAEPLSLNGGDTTYVVPGKDSGASFVAISDSGGTDTITAEGSSSGVSIDLRAARLDGSTLGGGGLSQVRSGDAGGFLIAQGAVIENAVGGSGSDVLQGNDAANHLVGGGGNDRLVGGGGNDHLEGGSGSDHLVGGSGNDLILGGSGNDRLVGGSGNDLIVGGSGNDVVLGGSGNDRLISRSGRNRLYGQNGNDVLIGGRATKAYGGSGNDRFVASGTGWKFFHGGRGRDTVYLPGRRGNYRILRKGRKAYFAPRGSARRWAGNVTTYRIEYVKFGRERRRRRINRRLYNR